nr:hypothetical protein CFP56_39086 [Quercus suber]
MEFQAFQDNAWYEVELVSNGDILTIKYKNFADEWDEIYHVGRFNTVKEIEDFGARFRRSSVQLQDGECRKVVQKIQHSFMNGEEECYCIFVLLWQHGPSKGTKTYASVASICFIRHVQGLVDQALDSFLKIARERLGIASHNQDSCVQKGLVCEDPGAASSYQTNSFIDVDAFFEKLRRVRRFRCAARTFEGRLNGQCKK